MYYSYVEIEYVATSFSPARTDLALKLLRLTFEMAFDDQAATKSCSGFLWCPVLLFDGRKSLCCTPWETDDLALFFPFLKMIQQ